MGGSCIKKTIKCFASSDYYELMERTFENVFSSVSDKYSCNAVMTAADEILSNIEKYSSLCSSDEILISIEVNMDAEYVLMHFEYGGILFDPVNHYKKSVLSVNSPFPGGRGLYLTGRIMDEFSYRADNGKNIVEIKKYLNS